LRARVEGLLQAHDNPDSFLEPPGAGLAPTADEPPLHEGPGMVIGPYKLLEQIGEGGFGVVFMAEQQQPIRRQVALKVLKPGMDSRQVIARFEAERQALALMDHPHIAKVLDGGATAAGRPYFVMELVRGIPITDFCDQSQLPVRQRLALFAGVCQAVQHAHQKGIIHRDLKPSNVLVTLQDGEPLVKVIDFGIAKALGQQLTDKTLFTGVSQMIGTPLYMSPEQAALSNVDVDTRSDVYSLGVLLYELLTGTTPFPRERLQQGGYDEMRRIIREEEPPRPSTRLSTLGQAATTVTAQRQSDPKRLSQLLRGELDWIVMKALEKERNRRYETASAFAADVQRYLADEPVQACPPSACYRLRKYARRNRARLAVAACGLVVVVVLAGGAGWFVWQKVVQRAETEGRVTTALSQAEAFLQEGDRQTDHPERWQAAARLSREALKKAEELLAADPAMAALADRVQQAREAVGAAESDSRLLVELERIRLEQAAVDVVENRYDWARAAPLYAKLLGDYGVDLAKPEAAAARVRGSRLREALLAALAEWQHVSPNRAERQRVADVYQLALPADSLRPRLLASIQRGDLEGLEKLTQETSFEKLPAASLVMLAQESASRRQWVAAERLLRAGLEQRPGDFWLNHELGMLFKKQQPPRAEEAVRYLTAALALRPDSPGVHLNLGNALKAKGDREGAICRYQAALHINPNYAAAHFGLGRALGEKNDVEGAIRHYRAATRIAPNHAEAHNNLGLLLGNEIKDLEGAIREFRAALGSKGPFPEAHCAHFNLGNALARKGQLDEAIAAYREAILLKKDHPEAHRSLGNALRDTGRLDEAIAVYHEALRLKKDFPEAHIDLGTALMNGKGDADGAIAEFRAALHSRKDFPEAYRAHYNLGNALQAKGRLDEAIAEYRRAIELKPDLPQYHNNLGLALYAKGLLDEAITEYRKALRLKKDDPDAHNNLGTALFEKGLLDEAVAEFREALRIQPDYPPAHNNLGNGLRKKGQRDEASAECREAIRLKKDYPDAHYNLGTILQDKGLLDEAIAAYREAIRLKKDYPEAHANLGCALHAKGQLDEAIAEFRRAIGTEKAFPEAYAAHTRHGTALYDKGQLDEAIAAYREAIRLKKDYPDAHFNLGTILQGKGQLDEAIAEFREAIRLKEDFPEAHCNLGLVLQGKGQFARALTYLRRGHELGSRNPRWPSPSARWVRRCERLVELDERLPGFLEGKATPASPAERIELAELCSRKRLHRSAARFYEEAFAREPGLADDPGTFRRYNAACAAALAAAGQGKDAEGLDEQEHARLRRQALDWLRADLAAWRRRLEKEPAKARPAVAQEMRHWLADSDFAGVRGPEALSKLPEPERPPWRHLWDDVADALARAQGKTMPGNTSDGK
jgi:tetratricopeptide (TPR) repeat protein